MASAAATAVAPNPAERSSQSAPRTLASLTDAVEIIDAQPGIPTRLMLTCEHASLRLPEPWSWPSSDLARLVGSHWSYDPGAEAFTRELSARVSSVGVLSRFSRLLCDPNRPLGADTMFRTVADGEAVQLNDGRLSDAEVATRVQRLYRPYHDALRRVHAAVRPTLILAPHSFTPVYEGKPRTTEIGVLYNDERDRQLADKFVSAYTSVGAVTRLNDPWSAKDGFMFAADQFAAPGTGVIMFEFRQDLLVQPEWRQRIVDATVALLREMGHA